MSRFCLAIALFAALGALALRTEAQTLGTPGTEVVYLVKDCALAGHSLGEDCFEDVLDLSTALWGNPFECPTQECPDDGIDPDAEHPLIVDIGPGAFEGPILCDAEGWVTFRGAGRKATTLFTEQTILPPVLAVDCEKLGFQDLSVEGMRWGVLWSRGGSTSWTDAEIRGNIAWQDLDCEGSPTAAPLGAHVFWNTQIEGNVAGVMSDCGALRFFGSQIVARPTSDDFGLPAAVQAGFRAELDLFSTDVRLSAHGYTEASLSEAHGVRAGDAANADDGYGSIRIRGGSVAVDTSTESGADAVALSADRNGTGDASVRALETGFSLAPGAGGDPIRVTGDGAIESAFLWPPATSAPAGLVSKTGYDLFVETDCDAAGDCSATADPPLNPHLMVYRESCTSKWFDTVTTACRP